MKRQMASKDLGDRYIVARFYRQWIVEDVADRSIHSKYDNEFDALVGVAKANKAYRKRRGWTP